MIGLFILIIAIIAGWAAYKILDSLPRMNILPILYVEVASGTENIEWLIRYICRQGASWRLKVLFSPLMEERRILERLAEKYSFELVNEIPAGSNYVLNLDKHSTPVEIKEKLSFMAHKLKREEKPLSRRI